MKSIILGSIFLALAASACGPGTACTEEARPGLEVVVVDEDGTRICDATVVANDGTDDETLSPSGEAADCIYFGATEKAGTYTISASKADFVDASEADVVVGEDECHVITESVNLTLEAAAQAE